MAEAALKKFNSLDAAQSQAEKELAGFRVALEKAKASQSKDKPHQDEKTTK